MPAAACTNGSITSAAIRRWFCCEFFLQFLQVISAQVFARHARRRAVAIGGGHAERLEQQRAEHGMEPLDPAHAHAAQRIAVIGVAEGQIAGLLRRSPHSSLCEAPRVRHTDCADYVVPLSPVLKRHFDRHFDGRGAVVGEEHVLQSRRGNVGQPLGQPDRGGIRAAEIGDVRHFVELGSDGRVDLRMAMAVDVAPQAADAVDVPVSLDIDQHAALGPFDHKRLVFGHLGEGVPDVGAVGSSRDAVAQLPQPPSGLGLTLGLDLKIGHQEQIDDSKLTLQSAAGRTRNHDAPVVDGHRPVL